MSRAYLDFARSLLFDERMIDMTYEDMIYEDMVYDHRRCGKRQKLKEKYDK